MQIAVSLQIEECDEEKSMQISGRLFLVVMAAASVLCLSAQAQQSSSARKNTDSQQANTPSKSGDSRSSANKTEKFHVRQEFGPQQASKRGDKMTADSPNGQGSSQGSTGSSGGHNASKNAQQGHESNMRGNHKDTVKQNSSNDKSGNDKGSK